MEIIEGKIHKFECKGETISNYKNPKSKIKFIKIINQLNEETKESLNDCRNLISKYYLNQMQQLNEIINNCEIVHHDKIQNLVTTIEKSQPKDVIDEWNYILQNFDEIETMKNILTSNMNQKEKATCIQFVDQIKQKLIQSSYYFTHINLLAKLSYDNQINETRKLANGLFKVSSVLGKELDISCLNTDTIIPKINHAEKQNLYLNETEFHKQKSCHLEIRQESIIWMDKNISNDENQRYLNQLKVEFHLYEIKTCTNAVGLNDLLREYTCSCLIISGSDGENLQNEINDNNEIPSILVFCYETKKHETWANLIPKVKVVSALFSEIKQNLLEILEMNQLFYVVTLEDFLKKYLKNSQEYFEYIIGQNSSLQSLNKMEIQQIITNTLNSFPYDVQNTSFRFMKGKVEDLSNHIFEHFESGKHYIKLYTKTEEPQYYKFLNKVLASLNRIAIQSFSPFISTLSFCIREFNDNQTDTFRDERFKLYRGVVSNPKRFLKNFKKGDIIVQPGFFSASKSKQIAFNYSQYRILYIIEFDVDSFGDHFELMRGKCIQSESAHPGEEEFLFKCFSCFKITKISKGQLPIEVNLVFINPLGEEVQKQIRKIQENQLPFYKRIFSFFFRS